MASRQTFTICVMNVSFRYFLFQITLSPNKITQIAKFDNCSSENSIEMCIFKNDIVIAGFDLKIHVFRKGDNGWSMFCAIQTSKIVAAVLSYDQNTILTVSVDGFIEKFTEEKSSAVLTPVAKLFR